MNLLASRILVCSALAWTASSCVVPAAGPEASVGDPAKGLVVLDGAAEGWRASLVLDNDPIGVWRMQPLPFFPQYATPEVFGLDDQGTCWVMVSYSGKWTPQRVLQDGAWLGAIAQGELDDRAEGPEVYVGGKKGNLYQIRAYADGGLDGRRIASFPGREIHTLVAGDLDPRHPGAELLVFTRPGGLYRVHRGAQGDFVTTHLSDLQGRIRDARVLPDGRTLVTASRDGRIRLLHFEAEGARWETIHRSTTGRGRLALGETLPSGWPVVYSSGDDGRVFRHEPAADGSWHTTIPYHGPLGPRGLVYGRFHPDRDRETIAVFGYSGAVDLLTRTDDGWTAETLFTDRDRGHWLSAIEIDGRNGCEEILLSGYGARMVLLSRDPGVGRPELAVPVAADTHAQR